MTADTPTGQEMEKKAAAVSATSGSGRDARA
jgi:hypothetical protein